MLTKSEEFSQVKVSDDVILAGYVLVYSLEMFPWILLIMLSSFLPVSDIPLYTQVREDEIPELELHVEKCWLPVPGGVENLYSKVNILLQTYISWERESFSLTSDLAYVAQVK